MFSGFRLLVSALAMLIVVVTAGSMLTYGTTDPCRMLSSEMSKDAVRGMNESLAGERDFGELEETIERGYRLVTTQYSTGECISQLGELWWDRLIGDR